MSEPTKQRPGDQPLPTPGAVCVQDEIIREMERSKKVGVERYGRVLETFNGRDMLLDAAEEIRDLHVYFTGYKLERGAMLDLLVDAHRALNERWRHGGDPMLGDIITQINEVISWLAGGDR